MYTIIALEIEGENLHLLLLFEYLSVWIESTELLEKFEIFWDETVAKLQKFYIDGLINFDWETIIASVLNKSLERITNNIVFLQK